MARLPEPGGDVGQWGNVLNDYLKVAHNDDGTLKDNSIASAKLQNNSVTVAKIATSGAPTDGQTLTYNNNSLEWATASGSGVVPDATTSSKGLVQLAGDLGGTATAPTVPGLASKEPTITAGTTAQYYRGDKSWRTLDKAAVGLSDVDNTADAAKPVSTAVQTALDSKASANDPRLTDTRTPSDNSVTAAKIQDGSISEPKLAIVNAPASGNVLGWDGTDLRWEAPSAAPVSSVSGRTGAVTLTKTDVGLANVDNTADASKPISTATQTALDGKAAVSHVHSGSDITTGTVASARLAAATGSAIGAVQLTGDLGGTATSPTVPGLAGKEATIVAGTTSHYYRGDKSWQTLDKTAVGLANVDNTADASKPVSTATQTALNGKANTSHVHAGADITSGTIAAARLPQATEAAVGAVQLASVVEATTGTDATKAVTAAGVQAAVNAVAHPILFVDSLGDIPPGTPVDTLVIVRAA